MLDATLNGRGIMGFFMDRHDLEGATATDLASAHMRDLASQERHGVKFLSYWFDYARNAAFCLVEAPDAEAAAACHRDAHGQVANEIIAVDPDDVARFLGRVDDPLASGRPPDSAFRIILFTDLEGSTGLVQRLGDDGAMRLLRIHDALIREAWRRTAGWRSSTPGTGSWRRSPRCRAPSTRRSTSSAGSRATTTPTRRSRCASGSA